MDNFTPMMKQYLEIKKQYNDCILFFRLGDFYEMFFEDAEVASKELEITLTGRDCGLEKRAPMCGVPHHAVDSYISKLVSKGYKVAICEQMEDPATAKGIVKRDVIRVITPGTIIDSNALDEKKNNYIMTIYKNNNCFGIAICDISTGDFYCTLLATGVNCEKIMDEIAKYMPSEILVNEDLFNCRDLMNKLNIRFNSFIYKLQDEDFNNEVIIKTLSEKYKGLDLDHEIKAAVAGLFSYLNRTQKVSLPHIQKLNYYKTDEFMVIDFSSRKNLELTETIRDRNKKGSLLGVIDLTNTSMGGRLLRKWIEQPLININDINDRLNAVEELKNDNLRRQEFRSLLNKVYDIERLIGKLVVGSINCRDLVALKSSLMQIPTLKKAISKYKSTLNRRIFDDMDDLKDIADLIEKSIVDDPPLSVKEGNIIKDSYNETVDKLRKASKDGKKWLAELETREREKTGIKNLKIGYNKVFGYFIEVTKSYYNLVPSEYIRKQTLVNCERFVTEELKNLEDTILGSEEKLISLEYNLFCEIREKIKTQIPRIKRSAECIAVLDVISSLAEVAERENYVKPMVNNSDRIVIRDGRHPVVEKTVDQNFVPNDTLLDLKNNRLLIITGPNMAGKSTYMRQVALIVLMAQAGSFVPASYAEIGIVDRIFTRVGASDDLATGQSTFMVEMTEVANILSNATERSLLILDEIGRGTSTFDGLSIAWAVIEYIANKERIGARTLFATHYHELTELEKNINGIKNYSMAIEEAGDNIVFLRKVTEGGSSESYGIEVAKLAGLPEEVVERAREILSILGNSEITRTKRNIKEIASNTEITDKTENDKKNNETNEELMNKLKILEEIKAMNIISMTPMEAMNALYQIQQKI